MKLLDLSEKELDMFINTTSDTTRDCALVRLLDMDEIETEEVIRIILDYVNKMIKSELKQSYKEDGFIHINKNDKENSVKNK